MSFNLSKYLKRVGADIHVLTLDAVGAVDFDSHQGLKISRIPIFAADTPFGKIEQKIRYGRALAEVTSQFRPDCILCIQWDPCAYIAHGGQSWIGRSAPYYLVVHGTELFQLPANQPARWTKSQLRSFALKGAHKIFAVSNFTRDRILGMGIAPDRVRVVPNGVETNGDSNIWKENRRDKSQRVLLTVSRLVQRKGHDIVLRALGQVVEKIPTVVYRIVGRGPEQERLERLVCDLNLEKNVEFYGVVNEQKKDELIQDCDIFVLPCRETLTDFEGFGIVFLEAMRYAKPVIGSRSGGIPDIIRDGENGLLVKPDDPDALAQAILAILASPDRTRRLGENGRRTVHERFRWDLIAANYLAELSDN